MNQIVNTGNAPAPVGPYNQAVRSGDLLFVSGQVAIDPATGQMTMSSIEAETSQVMANIQAILNSTGLDFANIVKCSVFVTDMGNYSRINAVYAKYFNDDLAPARELVEVSRLPKYANVEISVTASFD